MYFKTFVSENMINKKRFSPTSMNKKSFLQNVPNNEEILHGVIICFTIGLYITKTEKVLNCIVMFNTFLLLKCSAFGSVSNGVASMGFWCLC